MPTEENYIKKIGRILYIDPNDVFGDVDGVPMTPDYSDMCISFRLECQIIPRYKQNIAMAETTVNGVNPYNKEKVATKYQLNWNTPYGDIAKEHNWVSFLHGEMYNDSNTSSLTTYYTDINYEDYLKETIVEGLGIENITVAYENYYTPVITIKFVDHRGSSLFGREEVTHYDNKITIDSVFGAFFTAPYPKFRLQIKGFYGRAVTYQMTCSGFKGSLNPDTGNFEAIATFIGYSYSLLTDIPFEYLVAAPYCEYCGKDYWEEKKTQEEWRMAESYDGDETPTFFELVQRIEAAFNNADLLDILTEEEKQTVDNANMRIQTLESILSIYDDLYNFVRDGLCGKETGILLFEEYNTTEDGHETTLQTLYLVQSDVTEIWDSARKLLKNLEEAIKVYCDLYPDSELTEAVLPSLPKDSNFKSVPFFRVNTETGKISIIGCDNEINSLTAMKVNDVKISRLLGERILDYAVKGEIESIGNRRNAYLIDWGDCGEYAENMIYELNTKIKEINNRKERNYIHLAINNLGFVPYLGNFFKLILCHIETFIYMMNNCYLNIDNAARVNQRTPLYLGLPPECTDVAPENKHNNIPPWPLITKSNDETNYYLMYEKEDTYGWVGDFSPYFEEAKLVRALYLACKRTSRDPQKDEVTKPVEFRYLPILPNDLNNNLNPFAGGTKTISSMAGMVGIRAAQLFGIGEGDSVDADIAKLLGKMDALNYYRFHCDKASMGEMLEQHKDNLATTLYDIMLCNPSGDQAGNSEEGSTQSQHDFEFAKGMFPQQLTGNKKNRHPIFVEVNGILHYVYLHTKSRYALIPANTNSSESYMQNFTMIGDETNGTYFEYKLFEKNTKLVADKFLHYCCTTQLFEDYTAPEEKTRYVNNEMYTIATSRSLVSGILKRYKELKSGAISMLGEKFTLDMSKVIDRYWAVDDSIRYKYQTDSHCLFSKSYKDNKIEDKELLPNLDSESDVSATFDKLVDMKFGKFSNDGIKFDDDSENANIESLIIPSIDCYIHDGAFTLFGCDFFYLQNQITDEDTRNKVKALLFLHSLFYNKDKTMAWDIATKTKKDSYSQIWRMPFGFVALYGAFLWRHDMIVKNGADPIKYKDNGGVSYVSAYEKGKTEYTLFGIKDKKWYLAPISKGKYTYPVFRDENSTDSNAVFMKKPDYFVVNELIRVFEEFVSGQWRIISQMELTKSDGGVFANGSEFNEYVKKIIDDYDAAIAEMKKENVSTAKAAAAAAATATTGAVEAAAAAGAGAEQAQNDKKTYAAAFKDAANSFASFTSKYCFLWFKWKDKSERCVYLWNNPSNTALQNALRSVYLDDCIELRSGPYRASVDNSSKVGQYTDVTVTVSNLKSYLSGFAEQLEAIVKNTNNDVSTGGEDPVVVEETPEFNRETALPIYMYLKMLWDKWLVAMNLTDHEFMAKNMDKHFVFIDSFYRNISHRFMINCQTILECYNNVNSNEDITAFKFIADLVNRHNLMFVGLPDFVSGMVDYGLGGETKALESMKTIFTPIPYQRMNPIDETNKFVTIYIPRLSEIPSEMNGYTNDSFDIIGDETLEDFPMILQDDLGVEDESVYGLYMDYAYYVPSFGLAYGRQNNHFFTDINLTMETPIITSTVINTLSHIARKGANNTHRIAYVGQDLYPVFSNYSYICEFEMMGCAQIQPLMYFQLMNVPMWRGTYIIFSVTHNMTPGNMVTRVKAMKLSNRAVPYSNAWFTENPNFDPEALRRLECIDLISSGKLIGGSNISVVNGNGEGGSSTPTDTGNYGKGIFSGKTMKEQLAICEITSTGMSGSQIRPIINQSVKYKCGVGGKNTCTCQLNKHVVEDFQAIAEEVAQLGWFDFVVSSSWRPANNAYGHRLGIAVDINCPNSDGTPNPYFVAHLCVNGPEPKQGERLPYKIQPKSKYRGRDQPKSGYDRTKCIWYYNHPVAQIFRSHGWNWGGQFGDVMHFDLRGQPCASGQNTESRSNGGPCPSDWRC